MLISSNLINVNGTDTKGLETDYNVSIEKFMIQNLPQSSLLADLDRNLRPLGLSGCVCDSTRE